MLRALHARLRQKHRTIRYPTPAPALPARVRGRPRLDLDNCKTDCHACAAACPTAAINGSGRSLTLDLGRCLFCNACVEACPSAALQLTTDHVLAGRQRDHLLQGATPTPATGPLAKPLLSLFGRSLKLRQVSAGGCNGCEADVSVLNTVVFDLARFGVQFVASPRHADGLLVTGAIPKNMVLALEKTYAAVPTPKVVIATGACAISGGPYAGHDEVIGDLSRILPVDLFIPGCPPHPLTTLDGILRLLDRVHP
ncbi:MAG: 4Fe-4S binding protein [Deltaproteobacteria bacterium]|nr:4Fe-4S binding protein [Deltaproteobacteria bacterium]